MRRYLCRACEAVVDIREVLPRSRTSAQRRSMGLFGVPWHCPFCGQQKMEDTGEPYTTKRIETP